MSTSSVAFCLSEGSKWRGAEGVFCVVKTAEMVVKWYKSVGKNKFFRDKYYINERY